MCKKIGNQGSLCDISYVSPSGTSTVPPSTSSAAALQVMIYVGRMSWYRHTDPADVRSARKGSIKQKSTRLHDDFENAKYEMQLPSADFFQTDS